MYRLGKQGRLVVTTLKEPGPMQRHRDKQVGAGEYVRAGTLHPPPEGSSRVCMVAMLEPEQQAAAVLVVTQYGARLVPDWPLARAVATDRILTHRMGKGQTAKHHGGAKKVIPLQHRLHSASGCSMISPQERHRGGNTPSTSARPVRRFGGILAVKVAEAS
jgi:hypothetical protein